MRYFGAGVLTDRLDREATIHLPGSDLTISWPEDTASVWMTGGCLGLHR